MTITEDQPAVTVKHPLDPLTAAEIIAAAAIVRADSRLSQDYLFVRITLQEPAKDSVVNFRDGDGFERTAFVVLRDRTARTTIEATVSLGSASILDWTVKTDVQPPIVGNEFGELLKVIRNDPRWQAAMRLRGVEDFDLTMLDPWPAGNYGPEDHPSQRRIWRAITFVRTSPTDNGYARPIEGLVVEVDLDTRRVTLIEDHGVVPLPPRSGNYSPEGITDPNNVPYFEGLRQDLRPIEIKQPEGTSFQVDGQEVRWQKWRFRVGFNDREGLTLHTIGYEDAGRLRPLIYRASVNEMWIPYADPNPTHVRKQVFDMGEYGVGRMTNSLELGCDCLGEIFYFDTVVANAMGEPVMTRNAVCLHEEDFGLLWKHSDGRAGTVEVRRSRRLVVSSIATVGNYEYGFFWYFYQDGAIEFQTKLTGIMSTGAVTPGDRPRYGNLVAPGLYGPNHQHFFNVRLDMMLDGPKNTVYEVESKPDDDATTNPWGNAWVVESRPLRRESEAQRLIDPLNARHWKIVNPSSRNELGDPVGYKLIPGDNVVPFAGAGSPALGRAGFATRHLWVTRYDPRQLYAAGDYPNQHPGGAGLPEYVAADRDIEDEDVVVWYTLGHHHVIRPEDWPVMPVATIGFQLKPVGFFLGNPSLDVAPAMGEHNHGEQHNGHHNHG